MTDTNLNDPQPTPADYGSSTLPCSTPSLLTIIETDRGVLRVIVCRELKMHVLLFQDCVVAMHANGYSVYELAERIATAWKTGDTTHAVAQFDYIVRCGGVARQPDLFFGLYITQPPTQPPTYDHHL